MMRRVNLDIGANQRVSPDGDIGTVKKRAVGVDKNVLTEAYAVSVVAVKRRADYGC